MKEALKLALEALETERDIYRENDEDGAPEYILEAITVIEAALAASWGYRICEFCGCHTNAKARACCDAGRDADKALAKPAQREPLIAFRHGCKWCGELNGCEHKQPAQEPEIDLRTRWPMKNWAENKATPQQEFDYAYPTIEEYEELTGFKVNDTFRMGWAMARTTNDLFRQMEKNT